MQLQAQLFAGVSRSNQQNRWKPQMPCISTPAPALCCLDSLAFWLFLLDVTSANLIRLWVVLPIGFWLRNVGLLPALRCRTY
jgi:hypothetical protein